MNLFRVRGIQLAVHFSFFLLLAFFAYSGWQEFGWNGMVWSMTTLVTFCTCVVLHELGHCFTAMHFGVGVRRILLLPIGGMAEFDDIPRQPSRELLITLAGPAVNFAIAGGLWFFVPEAEAVPQYSLDGLIFQLFWGNLGMGIFNLLPAFPMDGGRIFRALLASRMAYMRATRWAVGVGKVVATLATAAALLAPEIGLAEERLYIAAVLFAFIFFCGELEYRMVQRREIEDAHWRAVLARSYAHLAAGGEPPILTR